MADGRAAALLARHRHALGVRALPRDRRLDALLPPRQAHRLARARPLARPVRRKPPPGRDHQDRLGLCPPAPARSRLALAAASQRRPSPRGAPRRTARPPAPGRATCAATPASPPPPPARTWQARQRRHRRRCPRARLLPLGCCRGRLNRDTAACSGGRRATRCRHARLSYGQPDKVTPVPRQRTPATQAGQWGGQPPHRQTDARDRRRRARRPPEQSSLPVSDWGMRRVPLTRSVPYQLSGSSVSTAGSVRRAMPPTSSSRWE